MLVYSPLEALQDISRLLELLSEEGLTGKIMLDAFCRAFELVLMHGNIARAMIIASRAASMQEVLEGVDSPAMEEWKNFASDPSQYQARRVSDKWKTASDDIPRDVATAVVGSWLWKKSAIEFIQYANLRTDKAFPSFTDLPTSIDASSYHPRGGFCASLPKLFLSSIQPPR